MTSFVPTIPPSTVPIVTLDVSSQIVLDNGATEIVFTRESLIETARNVGVTVGTIRVRTVSSPWAETKLPEATDLRLEIGRTDSELNVEVAPEVGEVIRISVPIVVTIGNGSELRNFTIAFAAGILVTVWWFLARRRRSAKDSPLT